jgi:hypothetical protein
LRRVFVEVEAIRSPKAESGTNKVHDGLVKVHFEDGLGDHGCNVIVGGIGSGWSIAVFRVGH